MALIKTNRKELKNLSILDFKEGDMIDVLNNNNDLMYTIHISYGEYKLPLKTQVVDKNWKYLSCTAGVKNGWPYYIADFIHRR